MGGIPSVTVTERVAGAISLSDVSETAPADIDRVMVSPTVVFWVASRVAVMVLPVWFLVETSFSITLPFSPASLIPE